MPFQRPDLTGLLRQARSDIAQATGDSIILRTSPLGIVAKAVGGLVHGLYGYLDWIALQSNPATATGEFLRVWAALVGIYQIPASAAAGVQAVLFTGTPGSILPNGTQLVRVADGLPFVTTALATVDGSGQVLVSVRAVDAGAAGSTVLDAGMVISSAVVGVNANGTVVTPIAGGADQEAEEDFRARMLARYREAPQGGAAADYVAWAREVPGVTRAWVAPGGAGVGTVVVYTMLDDVREDQAGFPQGDNGGATDDPRIVAATGDQLSVADHILPLQPVTAIVYSCAPIALPVNFTIADVEGDSAELRAAIAEALRGMLRRAAEPGGTIYPSDTNGAIASVPGIGRYTLVSPVAPVTTATGRLATLGTITWA